MPFLVRAPPTARSDEWLTAPRAVASPEASPDTPAAYQHPLHRRVSTDRRSPMQRFRAPPRKPLSVTDLVSPAWCEQQYEYSLTQHGRISPTAAMRLGKRLHRARESLVKVTRPVCVVSAEDRFALRLWNAITGLRALRVDGRARELEVVGVVDGEVVVGVIDELTSACPAADMEDTSPAADMEDADMPTYYLVDVKTRRSPSLPAPGVLERPMHMQLMLYHRLLAAQAANQVDPAIIFARYALNPHARLSDAFLATLSALAPAEHHEPEHHPTLSSLWALLTAESALTLPRPASLSPLLTAEYRSVSPDPAVPSTLLGRRSFPLDPVAAAAYVADALRWWRGARPTRGVPVAEAFKCRLCDFAPACVWRATRVEEPLRKAALAMERARSRV